MSNTAGACKTVSHRFSVNATATEIFPLLCPVREYDWIDSWSCRLIHSVSGFADANCVFETDFPNAEKETWLINRYEPPRAIEFVKMAADLYVVKYDLSLLPNDNGTTDMVWAQMLIGTSDAGNSFVENFDVDGYHEKMAMLGKMLNHYLSTGQRMSLAA